MGKRSGPAERLLQLLAGRWVPGAGKLGAAEEGRDVRMRESSGSTWKRNTKTQDTRMHRSVLRAGSRGCAGEGACCSPQPHLVPALWVEAPGKAGPHQGL